MSPMHFWPAPGRETDAWLAARDDSWADRSRQAYEAAQDRAERDQAAAEDSSGH
jgi:hypothetical protein